VYVLAHGAGAGMNHPFMGAVAAQLNDRGVATLRFQFPYAEAGRRAPDPASRLQNTIRAAVGLAERTVPGLPIVAGGKSMGGRMTSIAAANGDLPSVSALIFLGFPLHAPGKTGVERATHLDLVRQPMLFVQGTRDRLAGLDLIREVAGSLGERATLYVVDGGDHSFGVLKRSGRTQSEVIGEIASATTAWLERVVPT
jgi:predicted alpha/beta-hydrolase family hydrolase